ncbi:tetratricopeptide repeat protein [Fulvivirga sp. 29W222]|uniref:Tetratricopeptide repeat protein n=1 Tax=Fulvivirga marina TaxID=2494733 RepID=A0A937FTR8_9BACT|nr:tetratricopeptide repeat protein [Fulvivirga marina]MBL6445709.1 tetratricopeptide repeat protein [Fulvivirga marina]
MWKLIFCLSLVSTFLACSPDEIIEVKNKETEDLELTHTEFLKHKSEPEFAYPLLEKLKVQAQKLGNNEFLAKYYTYNAVLKRNTGDYETATNSYSEALELYGKNNDSYHQGLVYLNLGSIYYQAAFYEKALSHFEKAEQAFLKAERKEKLSWVYQNISLIHIDGNRFYKAELYLKQGIDLAKGLGNNTHIGEFLNLYGKLHFKQQEFNEARQYYNRALEYSASELQTSYIYGNIAETYIKEGNIAEAEKWLSQAIALKNKIEGADLRPNLNYSAELEALKGNNEKALVLYDEVVQLSKADLSSKELGIALNGLSTLYSVVQNLNYDQLSRQGEYLKVYNQRSQQQEEQRNNLETLYRQASIRAAEVNQERKQALKEKDEKFSASQTKYLELIGACLLAIVLSVFFYRKRLRKEKKEKERLQVGMAGFYQDLEDVSAELNIEDTE